MTAYQKLEASAAHRAYIASPEYRRYMTVSLPIGPEGSTRLSHPPAALDAAYKALAESSASKNYLQSEAYKAYAATLNPPRLKVAA